MAKTKEELKALEEEIKSVADQITELTEEELRSVCGGARTKDIDYAKLACLCETDL